LGYGCAGISSSVRVFCLSQGPCSIIELNQETSDVCACFFSSQNSIESLLDGAVGYLQLRRRLVGLGKNIMPAVKARAKRQENEQNNSEKFAAVVYLLLPPNQKLLKISRHHQLS